MTTYVAQRAPGPLRGELALPGDKSLSHRAVLFAAMAEGTSHLRGILDSADVRSTIAATRALGAVVSERGRSERGLDVHILGWGEGGPSRPVGPVDCGNSGTTARLLLGVLAGWPIAARLEGDASLSSRPMARVTEPLGRMGAKFDTAEGTLPITVAGRLLRPIDYRSPISSAQVKTAILLAGLRAEGRTRVSEPSPSRDHTERLLPVFGVPVGRDEWARSAWVDGPRALHACDLTVPADPSSAAFFAAAASLVSGSDVLLPDVSLNPTRTGFLRVLERMGAKVEAAQSDDASIKCAEQDMAGPAVGEHAGTIRVRSSDTLVSTLVTAQEIPTLIDEVPVLALVATQALGTTRFEGVGELRVKESDRLAAITAGLSALGAYAECGDDWLEVTGPTSLKSARLDSLADHRLAMTWCVAGLVARGPVTIDRFDAIDVSYPRFAEDLAVLGTPLGADRTS